MTEHDTNLILLCIPLGEGCAVRRGIIWDKVKDRFAKSTFRNHLKELHGNGRVQRRERRDNSGIYYEYWREREAPAKAERAA